MRAARRRFPVFGTHAIVFAMLALALALALTQPARSQSVAERFIGVYTLAEYWTHGDEPTGRISYDAAGRMSAMLLPPGREPITRSSSAEEFRENMRGVIVYYGTYEIDESTGRVIHHVEAASNPEWIGDDFVRWYRFDGQDLVLSLNPEFERPLHWKRLPDG